MGVVAMGRVETDEAQDFADVFAAHHAEMLRVAYLLCGCRHRAEDAVAEAFAKMYRSWRRGRIDHPRAYLRRAVVNEVNSRFRRLAVERREASRRHGDDRGAQPADEVLADRSRVLDALAVLPTRQRTAVVLRYYGDLSQAETAAAMGVALGTVKSCVARGLDRLRLLLDEEVA